ncbi:MAG TPA: MazG nucleotide pyrophosphohydrolase domain-containing protein [Thermodesulfobacteriota bacterium]|nr:MazG nucleotide pyrophosphohydrolase domain-containing protein [Thermodesulfobacteriota bacterium]
MMKKVKKEKGTHRVEKKGIEKAWRSVLDGARKDSSSLSQAYRLTQIASRVGFDWPNIEGVLEKLDEEMREFREALALQDRKKIYEEIGDLFFVLANVSRLLHLHPEGALRKTLNKFISRFHYIEASLHRKGKSLRQSDLAEMERLWEESKKKKIKKEIL